MPHSGCVGAGILYVFAKEPRAGVVKTRLCPPLKPDQAERVYRALLMDTLSVAAQVRDGLGADACAVVIAASPDASHPELKAAAGRFGFALVPQGAGDLGKRMWRILEGACARNAHGVVIGSDCPELEPSLIVRAFEVLKTSAAVLGPSRDGGYYLIGCRGTVPPVFELDAAWGGPGVLSETRSRISAARVAYGELPERGDIDSFDDLSRLATRLAEDRGAAQSLPACTALLSELVAEGFLPATASGPLGNRVEETS